MIEIFPYRATWPDEFQEIARRLRAGLGATAVRIDHIGSTAVPGLAAKDIIDIQVSVAALDQDAMEKMSALGYSKNDGIDGDHRPPHCKSADQEWQKWFFRPPVGQRPANIHVRVVGHANQQYPLLFRDYLREHPASAASYAELKRRLARNLKEGASYPEVKDPAVDLIYLAAIDWAAVSGWQLGPSDA